MFTYFNSTHHLLDVYFKRKIWDEVKDECVIRIKVLLSVCARIQKECFLVSKLRRSLTSPCHFSVCRRAC